MWPWTPPPCHGGGGGWRLADGWNRERLARGEKQRAGEGWQGVFIFLRRGERERGETGERRNRGTRGSLRGKTSGDRFGDRLRAGNQA